MKFPLGYIGVGLMGGPMVKRLTARGWQVMAYDIVPERSAVSSVADAVRGADVVLLNLPTNDAGLAAKMINQLIVGVGHAMLARPSGSAKRPASMPPASPSALPAATPIRTS
jgi:prephenate dehydrogenase